MQTLAGGEPTNPKDKFCTKHFAFHFLKVHFVINSECFSVSNKCSTCFQFHPDSFPCLCRDLAFRLKPLEMSDQLIQQLKALQSALEKEARSLQELVNQGKKKMKHYAPVMQEVQHTVSKRFKIKPLDVCPNLVSYLFRFKYSTIQVSTHMYVFGFHPYPCRLQTSTSWPRAKWI